MDNDEKEQWIDAIRADVMSFENLEVFDQVTPDGVRALRQEGIHPKRLVARLILVKKPDPQEHHGWKPKAR
eukprot:3868153-Prorocentrum_lima.AAC.1